MLTHAYFNSQNVLEFCHDSTDLVNHSIGDKFCRKPKEFNCKFARAVSTLCL